MTVVIIPEYVAHHWWEQLLYNQTAKRLRRALLGRPETVIDRGPLSAREGRPIGATARAASGPTAHGSGAAGPPAAGRLAASGAGAAG